MLSFFTVDKEKKSAKENYDDSHTFGGFSSRWNYEDCRRRLSGVHPAAIVLISAAFEKLFLLLVDKIAERMGA